ncbi:MAG TPA: glycosyltransferase [Methyloprofundus sp.]|nr:glycosyltransferase [Methyloprofundus sp.]HIL78000.1 glycosyltransferase [Methylococcales bacterium]
MNILFIHRDLPAQFASLIRYFAASSQNKVFGICDDVSTPLLASMPDNVTLLRYPAPVKPAPQTHHYVLDLERGVLRAQCVVKILQKCRQQGVHFDLIIAHIGWGEALYVKDLYPEARLLGYAEFFFHTHGADVGFDPAFPVSLDFLLQVKTFNAQLLLGLNECDALVTPTYWQKSLFPKQYQTDMHVIHEGVDIDQVKPDLDIHFTLACGLQLDRSNEVITYCARSLEPYRGFPVFIKALEIICQQRPKCHILIVGGDEVSYSPALSNGQSYREKYLQEAQLPVDRVHFLGHVSYTTHLQLLQLSSVHIYLTYPFVLSWSFMEAMASECVLICSNTLPVVELIEHQKNGLLVDFFDYQTIAEQVEQVFNHSGRMNYLGRQARQTISQHYQRQFSLAQYQNLCQTLISDT